jgi:hypothetical protein
MVQCLMKPSTTWCLLALLGLPALAEAGSLRCDDRVIRTGDLAWELERACGAPDVIEALRWVVAPDGGVFAVRELWVYNFGPRRLIREIDVENGRIIAIRSARPGYRALFGGPCRPTEIRRGMSRIDLLARCGEPDARTLLKPRAAGWWGVPGDVIGPAREQWVYDFSPRGLPRVVVLEGGTVTRVEQLSRR